MIDANTLNRVRASTCGVGRFLENPDHVHQDPSRANFEILGTGFLIADTTAITNNHVIEALHRPVKGRRLPQSWEFLLFVHPTAVGWRVLFQQVKGEGVLDPVRMDIALLEFDRPPSDPEFEVCQPVRFGDLAQLRVSQPVAVTGYPHGEAMLKRGQEQYRFGPVLQQGYISAIAPIDAIPGGAVNELLLDVRAAGGMSGSPVFVPATGDVIGMLSGGWVGTRLVTTSIAIPIGENEAGDLLAVYRRAKERHTQR